MSARSAGGPAERRVLVVYCHPNPESFTHAVLEEVQAGLRAGGCVVETLDLHAEGFDPVLVVDRTRRRRDLDKVEETRPHREQLARCDAVVLVYPVWWGGFPAILKGWIDRVLVSGVAYSFEGRPPSAVFPRGLLRDKQLHCFYTLDSPWWVALVDPGWFSSLFSVFSYCGFASVRRHYLARLKRTSEAERAAWLAHVRDEATILATGLRRG